MNVGYPTRRLRRLRYNKTLRAMLASVRLSVDELIAPLFVHETLTSAREIPTMPGQFQRPVAGAAEYAAELAAEGIRAVLLFGMPKRKDPSGRGAWDDEGIVQHVQRARVGHPSVDQNHVAVRHRRREPGQAAAGDHGLDGVSRVEHHARPSHQVGAGDQQPGGGVIFEPRAPVDVSAQTFCQPPTQQPDQVQIPAGPRATQQAGFQYLLCDRHGFVETDPGLQYVCQ